ncbi:Sodium- and chloride-dependent GABA transporter [Trichinella spiralis]|uniref:Transporter n=1 Tax=Trichinella spiralis TaxID=6334 RepID=A0ABR3KYX4_TRISP
MGLSENFEEQRQPFDESKSITDNKDSSLVTLNKKWSLANSKIIPRETWTNTFEFILSCIGYSVGLGNIWRFPYLCYQNGGGAFLIPYVISLVFCGIPMFVLEASWGQLLSIGGLGMWELCPILKGAGIAATVCAFWLNIYYIVVLAWALIYFFYSFYNVPWGDCNNWWNTEKCVPEYGCRSLNETLKTFYNTSDLSQYEISNFNSSLLPANLTLCNENSTQAVREFWERNVLHISNGIEEPGSIIWQLSLALFVAWALCYFAIFKGIKWTGKVLYVTALFPYVILLVLFFRGVTLPGAGNGIYFYLAPDFSKLSDSNVWIDAVTQIFFTYGLALGAIVALGSYNNYHNGIVKQAALICILDSSTSFFTGFVVFSFIGYMAYEQNQPVDQVAMSGPGLLFLAYPSGILKLPGAAVWSALFFLMVILIGIDSQFCTMEGFFTALIDEFPRIFRRKYGREIFIFIICFLSYLIGLSMTCEGGMYVFKIFDFYGASGWVLLWLLFFECIAISWCYGLNKWYENLKDMVGYYPSLWWKFCWGFSCPAVCFGVTLFSLIKYEGPKYPNYTFPTWAHVIGWLMSISSMICIPVYAIYLYIATPGSFRHKMKILVSPDVDIAALRFSNCCDALPMSEADTTAK